MKKANFKSPERIDVFMNDDSGINKETLIQTSTAFERWELPALLEQEEIDKEAQLVEQLPTLEEIEKIREDAYQEGYEAGKKKGTCDGLKNGEKLTQQKISLLVSAFGQPLQEQDDRLEKVLLDMTIQLTTAIIRRELSIDSETVTKIILEVFEYVEAEEEKFRIQLNPADVKGVAYFLEKQYEGEANYQLISDNQVNQGGCIIRSDAHYVDAQIETLIDKMLEEVYSQEHASPVAALEDQPAPPQDYKGVVEDEKTHRGGILSAAEADSARKVDLSSMPFFDSENDV